MRPECRNCAHFQCEVMQGDGKPLEDRGECFRNGSSVRRFVEADDWCNQWRIAKWAEGDSI